MLGDRGNDVTAGTEFAPLLEESAEELYEHAPAGYLSMLPDGRIVKANETLLEWTGYRREELVGVRRLHDILAPGARIYYETHYAPLLQMQGSVREVAVELVRADASRLPVLLNSTLVHDDSGTPRVIRTTVFNASDRRKYEQELLRARADAEARARAALALANVDDGVLLVGVDGRLEVVNPAAEAIFGIAAAEAVGMPAADAIAGWATLAPRIPVADASRRGEPAILPLERDGREQWLAIMGVDSGEGVVYTVRDVTSDQRLEALRSDIIAVVSHELRTPLTGASGAASTLLARYDDLDRATHLSLLEMIVTQSARLSRIVEQILLTNALDTGEMPVADDVFDAAAAVEAAVRPHLPTGRLTLDVEHGLRVRGAEHAMRQVLDSIVDNALKYSDGTVRVAVEAAGNVARFTVADEGPGIPHAEQDRIFERFYRLDPNQRMGVGGTGLGLYIARGLLHRMRGRIGLAPSDRGATFVVELPLAPR